MLGEPFISGSLRKSLVVRIIGRLVAPIPKTRHLGGDKVNAKPGLMLAVTGAGRIGQCFVQTVS